MNFSRKETVLGLRTGVAHVKEATVGDGLEKGSRSGAVQEMREQGDALPGEVGVTCKCQLRLNKILWKG